MGVARIELSNGRVVRVEAPSQEAALQYVQDNMDDLLAVSPETAPQPEQASALRPAGISSRGILQGAIKGVGALGSLPLDAAYNIYAGLSSDADLGMPFTGAVARSAERAGDMLGLPQPESTRERLMTAAAEGATGALVGGPVAGSAVGAAGRALGSKVASSMGKTLAQQPVTQGVAGAAGGLGTQTGEEMGMHPAISAGMGVAAGVGASAPLAAASAAHQLAKPWYGAGRRDVVGNLLRETASDPATAARNIDDAATYVPGSAPTTAAAARDAGLNSLSKGVERLSPRAKAAFDERCWDNNAARNAVLDDIVPTEGAQTARADTRSAFADAATARLFDSPQANARVEGAFGALDDLKQGRLGKRRPVRHAAQIAERELASVAQGGQADPGDLYAARQNIAELLEGNQQMTSVQMRDGTTTNLRAARKAMMPVLEKIDDAIEEAAPGFKDYMRRYTGMSEEISQGDVLRQIREASTSRSAMNPTGEPTLMLSGLKRQIDSIKASKDFGRLTQTQQAVLKRIRKDLEREDSAVRSVASAGSDTAQNLSTGAFIAKMVGGRGALPRTLVAPLEFLYKIPERQMQDLLIEAMLDPKVGARLLRKATPENVRDVSTELSRIFAATQASGRASAGVAADLAEQSAPHRFPTLAP